MRYINVYIEEFEWCRPIGETACHLKELDQRTSSAVSRGYVLPIFYYLFCRTVQRSNRRALHVVNSQPDTMPRKPGTSTICSGASRWSIRIGLRGARGKCESTATFALRKLSYNLRTAEWSGCCKGVSWNSFYCRKYTDEHHRSANRTYSHARQRRIIFIERMFELIVAFIKRHT